MSYPGSKYLSTACPQRPPLYVAPMPLISDGRSKIRRVLIANRGEIACRIISTCRKLNLISIAIYVEEDVHSLHITQADESVSIGSLTAGGTNPFLNIDLLVKTAVRLRADAIHPGYGYLSENSDFASAVQHAGLIFIGPSPQAMSTLGDKRTAKDYLRKNESAIPLIPGFSGSSQEVSDFEMAAEDIGFPVMLKASAGGGGRGMRIVRQRSALRDELARARSEAARSFGSSDCILEKYIEAGKHIEIQIMGDSFGNVISLHERECSIQRRHQKIIEESPSPWLTSALRKAMSATAVRIGELLKYEGAGTVEFVVDVATSKYYFLEVNTRLQVEHCITEEVTGLDIVALQLFVAAGGQLSSLSATHDIPQVGHSIECRLCAEDPQRDFFPEHGTIRLWQPPKRSINKRDVRYETAVQTGSQISIHFDSMIAKIVVWAPTRSAAVEKMVKTLAETLCIGLRTNQLFLQSCLLHLEFSNPSYTTSFIPDNFEALLLNPHSLRLSDELRTLAAAPAMFSTNISQYLKTSSAARPFSGIRRTFRNQRFDPINQNSHIITIADPSGDDTSMICIQKPTLSSDQQSHSLHISPISFPKQKKSTQSTISEVTTRYLHISNTIRSGKATSSDPHLVKVHACNAQLVPSSFSSSCPSETPWLTAEMDISINSRNIRLYIATENAGLAAASSGTTQAGQGQSVFCHFPALGTWFEYRVYSMLAFCESVREEVGASGAALSGTVRAPMPCKILSVAKNNGDEVREGETIMVVESMKMEMKISSPKNGVFGTTLKEGNAVNDGVVLFSVE